MSAAETLISRLDAPGLFNRTSRESWEKHGMPGSYDKALEIAKAEAAL